MATCGVCKTTGLSVAQIKAGCASHAHASAGTINAAIAAGVGQRIQAQANRDAYNRPAERPAPGTRPATDKQRGFIDRLRAERNMEPVKWSEVQRAYQTTQDASAEIERLLTLPRPVQEVVAPKPRVPNGRYALVEDGATKDEHIAFYRVTTPEEGRWVGRTFIDIQASDDFHPIRDKARRALILERIEVNPQEAMERYGKELGACGHCGRTLTNPESIERGIGPVCADKMGW